MKKLMVVVTWCTWEAARPGWRPMNCPMHDGSSNGQSPKKSSAASTGHCAEFHALFVKYIVRNTPEAPRRALAVHIW
eukprot:COSAG01_NODE_1384_length_10514_cov_17.435046_13_plen_77_part_00